MEIDSGMVALPQPVKAQPTILCCNCGSPIDGTTAVGALCTECIKLTVDVSQGVQRDAVLHTCGDCDRWFSPPQTWVSAQPESRELLALCLRKLRGLNKVRIIDASFIWTEPHSRRVKVKLTIQQENGGSIIQQSFEVEYVVANQQCPDCRKSYTHHVWRAVVQLRQKVPHKRTFLYLEQLMLKHGAHKDAINIKESHEGIDFFFGQRNHAEKFVDFLGSVAPVFTKKSEELISQDTHTSKKQYKFSYSVEIVPVCKDDLVALPIKMSKQSGNINPLVLCSRIGTAVNLLDPQTLQTADLSAKEYWHTPFAPLADVTELSEFLVLDIEPLGPTRGNLVLAEATISPAADMSTTYYVRTHLGAILNSGDTVLGYHLTGTVFNNPQFEALEDSKQYASQIPDVILVKKHYHRKHKARGITQRNWRLKRMNKEESEMLPRKQDQDRLERDFELFLRDVEEDKDLRATVALYKAQQKNGGGAVAVQKTRDPDDMDEDSEDDDDSIQIPLDQLLEDMNGLELDDAEMNG